MQLSTIKPQWTVANLVEIYGDFVSNCTCIASLTNTSITQLLFPVHVMTLKQTIIAQNGVGIHRQTSRLKRLKVKLSSAKNSTLFLDCLLPLSHL